MKSLPPFPFEHLLNWYRSHGRHSLPWRRFEEDENVRSYHVWLSEILLQQTQADRVIPFYEKMLERFPTVDTLAKADYETFFPYYSGLGYYSRARNLLKTAKVVHENFRGAFPKKSEELRSLLGIGAYTAEAIRAFAYGIPTLAFDTNLEKIFARYYHGSRFLKLSAPEKESILSDFLSTGISAREMNAALMDYASIVSKNSKNDVDWQFPLPGCKFSETRGGLELPPEKKKNHFPTKDAKIVAILHENHKRYFSNGDSYEPFILPPTELENRAFVKAYFKEHHNLEVSVRPVHEKAYVNDEPYVFVHVQVQSGTFDFKAFSREEFCHFKKSFSS